MHLDLPGGVTLSKLESDAENPELAEGRNEEGQTRLHATTDGRTTTTLTMRRKMRMHLLFASMKGQFYSIVKVFNPN